MNGNKIMAALSYFGILVLIPIFAVKDDAFVRYHANQGLILLIAGIASGIIGSIVGFIPVIGMLIAWALSVILFVFFALGLINVFKGEMKPLPFIGGIQILR